MKGHDGITRTVTVGSGMGRPAYEISARGEGHSRGISHNGPEISSWGNQVGDGTIEKRKLGKGTGWKSETINTILNTLSLKHRRLMFLHWDHEPLMAY